MTDLGRKNQGSAAQPAGGHLPAKAMMTLTPMKSSTCSLEKALVVQGTFPPPPPPPNPHRIFRETGCHTCRDTFRQSQFFIESRLYPPRRSPHIVEHGGVLKEIV